MGTQLTIIAGKSAHRRKAKPRDWTRAKEAKFLGALAETCNVTLSAELAGVSGTTVYRHRAKDAAFRDGWDRALAQGFARLEIEMLERALRGSVRTIVHKDLSVETMVEYPDRIGLALLKMHRDRAEAPARRERDEAAMSAEEIIELRDKIMAKLERVTEQAQARLTLPADGSDGE